jgi:hypothetical protein
MAKTITQLPDATTVGESDEMIVQQSGITKRATIGELKAQVATLGARDITVSGAARSITNTTNHALSFGTNNTERVRISNSGNVGIGTTSPSTLLDCALPSGSAIITAQCSATTGTDIARVVVRNGTVESQLYAYSSLGAAVVGTTSNHPFALFSNTTERMRIAAAGNVGVGTSSPNAAAVLDVSSTTQGFLPPRMTTTERNDITTPPAGLMVYNTTTNKLNFYNGTAWEAVTSA